MGPGPDRKASICCEGCCCPCCYKESCHRISAQGGTVCCFVSFFLFILGVTVPNTVWLAALVFFLFCPISIIVGLSGICCLNCCVYQEDRGHEDIEAAGGAIELIPTAVAREEVILQGHVVSSSSNTIQNQQPGGDGRRGEPVAIPISHDGQHQFSYVK